MGNAAAEREIVRIYRYEYLRQPDAIHAAESPDGALHFYSWLEVHHSEALEYQYDGDKYQDVAAMVQYLEV